MKKYMKLALLVMAGSLSACQTVVVNDGNGYGYGYPSNYVAFQEQRVNLYHNVHYNNPGFYPRGSYQTGGYYWMRGYRY